MLDPNRWIFESTILVGRYFCDMFLYKPVKDANHKNTSKIHTNSFAVGSHVFKLH